MSSYPAPSSSSVGNNINYLRVRLPSSTVKSYFAKAIGNGDLTVGRELDREGGVHGGRIADHHARRRWTVRAVHPESRPASPSTARTAT